MSYHYNIILVIWSLFELLLMQMSVLLQMFIFKHTEWNNRMVMELPIMMLMTESILPCPKSIMCLEKLVIAAIVELCDFNTRGLRFAAERGKWMYLLQMFVRS